MRVRLDLAYEGTGYAGWARQPDQRTVQGVLEDALGQVLRLPEPPNLTVAGRTDAGVHARGQVTHADVESVPSIRWLNALLPDDVRVRAATAAVPGFDARFSALSRRYSYRVTDGPVDPLRRRDTLGWGHSLDLAAMNAAAQPLTGEHDFAAYCKRREGATTIRRLIALTWTRAADGVLEARVEADAFCHSMVRALVGALLTVGQGRRPPQWPGEVLAAGVRDSAVPVVPAHGLCLEEVCYPPDAELAARATATRRVRVPEGDCGEDSDGSIR
jgi:tRNA pseudouridine38-40 synthase